MRDKNKQENGALNDASVIQRLTTLKETLTGLIISESKGNRTVFYDGKTKHFITLNQKGKISFSTIYPKGQEGEEDVC